VLVFSLLIIVQFFSFFFAAQGAMLVYPRAAGEYHVMLGAHLFGLPNVSQACLEPVAAVATAMTAHLFSQCNVAWRSFLGLGGQGVEVLILLGVLFPPCVASASQQGFGVTELTLSGSAP
jgi:hypothetical protein